MFVSCPVNIHSILSNWSLGHCKMLKLIMTDLYNWLVNFHECPVDRLFVWVVLSHQSMIISIIPKSHSFYKLSYCPGLFDQVNFYGHIKRKLSNLRISLFHIQSKGIVKSSAVRVIFKMVYPMVIFTDHQESQKMPIMSPRFHFISI